MCNTNPHIISDLPKRVIAAWSMGEQEQLIADATVIGDRLLVFSCGIRLIYLPKLMGWNLMLILMLLPIRSIIFQKNLPYLQMKNIF